MNKTLLIEDAIATWEGEGGSLCERGFCRAGPAALDPASRPTLAPVAETLTGTVNQIQWAVQIKARVNAEFDSVAKALLSVTGRQTDQNRTDTQAIVASLEEKRAEVMARTKAGYFIHDWQELSDQVRKMIVQDPRYLAIRKNKTTRQR
jgi:hypothetical protein